MIADSKSNCKPFLKNFKNFFFLFCGNLHKVSANFFRKIAKIFLAFSEKLW